MPRLAALAFVALFVVGNLTLAGCNTVRGAGQDLEAAGQALAATAERTRDRL